MNYYFCAFTRLVVKRSSISLMEQFDLYLGAECSEYWMCRVVEILDPGTSRTLSAQKKIDVLVDLSNVFTSKGKLLKTESSSIRAQSRGRSAPTPVRTKRSFSKYLLAKELYHLCHGDCFSCKATPIAVLDGRSVIFPHLVANCKARASHSRLFHQC
jgi:hypothetical protein